MKKYILRVLLVIICAVAMTALFFTNTSNKDKEQKVEAISTDEMVDEIVDKTSNNLYELFLTGNKGAIFEENGDVLKVEKLSSPSKDTSDINYAYSDIDLDGTDELHVKWKDVYYILKEKKDHLVVWAELSVAYEPVEGGGLLYNTRNQGEENRYCVLSSDGKLIWEVCFLENQGRYFCDNVEISEEQWNKMSESIRNMTRISWIKADQTGVLEICEGEGREIISEHNAEKAAERDRALQLYDSFVSGNYVVKYDNGINEIKYDMSSFTDVTGEPEKHYATRVAIVDIDHDKIEELCVENPREHCVFRYSDGELIRSNISEQINRYSMLMNNGGYLLECDQNNYGIRTYSIYGREGQLLLEVDFSMECPADEIFVQAEESDITYTFMGTEVSKEQYDALTKRYYDIGTDQILWKSIY